MKNNKKKEEVIKRLVNALEPFAEKPGNHMDNYRCHLGITTKEKCGRCSRATEAYYAIQDVKLLGGLRNVN